MLLSIIIPVYNAERYLSRCLDSIINQTYKELEIILIDDGSTDDSSKICDKYKNKDDRVKVIHSENRGASVARNCGLKLASGDYIGFVDADDYVEKNMYEYLINNLIKTDADISICNYSKNEETNFEDCIEVLSDKNRMLYEFIAGKIEGYLWNKLISKNLFKDIMFPKDINICEDKYILWKIIKKCNRICKGNKILYHYIQNENSICNKKFSVKRLDILNINMQILNDAKKLLPNKINYIETKIAEENIRIAFEIVNANYKDSKVERNIEETMSEISINSILNLENNKSWIIYGILLKVNFNIFKRFHKIFNYGKKEKNE